MNFFKGKNKIFQSKTYWENRYKNGGNSGAGSYGELALFKADVINTFVRKNCITSIIEFGCGDGNQIKLGNYPRYIGLDVSKTIIKKCIKEFASDSNKNFFLYDNECYLNNNQVLNAELGLSLDVIYHLIENDTYNDHLKHLFAASLKYVIIYSTDIERPRISINSHEKHRNFTKDVSTVFSDWKLINTIENPYKPKSLNDDTGSEANFYIYQKQ